MTEIKLVKRIKYAGDVHARLLDCGWDIDTATAFLNNIPDAKVEPLVRCKDCSHYDSMVSECYQWGENNNTRGGRCWVDGDHDFCSRWEVQRVRNTEHKDR